MKHENTGFAIINIGHPRTGEKYIVNGSFRSFKRTAINDFINISGNTWKYWRTKFNFRCVRVTETITTVSE